MSFIGNELSGVVILDLSQIMAGPFATKLLADFGARVIKVESPKGDPSREYPPFSNEKSLYFYELNDGKEVLQIDLKSEEGKDKLKELIQSSDVMIENFKNGVMERLGFTEEDIMELNNELSYFRISGHGKDDNRPYFDLLSQAESGLIDLNQHKIPIPIGDLFTGLYSAIGILTRLVSKSSGVTHLAMDDILFHALTYRSSNILNGGAEASVCDSRHPYRVASNVFSSADGKVAIHASSDRHFQSLCEALNMTSLFEEFSTSKSRLENRNRVDAEINRRTVKIKTVELCHLLESSQVPVQAVRNLNQAVYEYEKRKPSRIKVRNGLRKVSSPFFSKSGLK